MSRILDMLQELEPRYHPLTSILMIAHQANDDLRLQLDCHKTIVKYVEPEQRSIEYKSNGDDLVKLQIVLDKSAIDDYIDEPDD